MPSETPLPPKRKVNIELLLSLSATFLSLAALIVSVFQTKIAREQQHASVWPYLQLSASSNSATYQYGIENKGIGPEIVRKVEWVYGDSVYKHVHEFIFNEIGFTKGLGRSKIEPGAVFNPAGGVSMISVYENDSLVNVVSKILESDSFNLRVTYSDVYGNCCGWTKTKPKSWQIVRTSILISILTQMSYSRIFLSVLITASFAVSAMAVYAQSTPKQYLIKAGQMYDSEENVFLKNQQILIKGNRIVKVGGKVEIPAGTIILDYSNATVSPGLIDAHTHILTNQGLQEPLSVDAVMQSSESRVLRGAHYAKTHLDAGFTTIRDLGNSGQYLDVEVRNAIDKGYIKGPRMLVSGPIIGSMDGQLDGLPIADFERVSKREYSMVSGVEEAIKTVKEHITQGVDVIKIMAIGNRLTLSLDEQKAIVRTAHEQRVKVTAHCDRDWAAQAAIEAGVDGIEHGYSFRDTTFKLMAKKGIYLVPTYGSLDGFVRYHKLTHQEYNVDEIKKSVESWKKGLLRAKELGVMIVAGSDAYHNMKIPRGEDAKYTLSGYYEYGLSAEDVLKTATVNAAVALELKDEVGVIKENASADIAVFEGDLSKDFKKTLFDVKMVMKGGEIQYQK